MNNKQDIYNCDSFKPSKNTKPIVKNKGMTVSVTMDDTEFQVIDPQLVIKQLRQIEELERQVRSLSDQFKVLSSTVRQQHQEISYLKVTIARGSSNQ